MSYAVKTTEYIEKRVSTRRNFLRKRFTNGIDVVRFYWLIGRVAAFPILGRWFIRPVLNLYIKYIDNNGIILPYAQIEEIINSSRSLFIDPCDCRLEFGNCNAPLYTCLKIDLGAEIRQQDTNKDGISKEQALAIAKNAAQNGLVFCLEQCIQPYNFNICMCCSCCCIVHRFKYELGHKAFFEGPYIPIIDENECQGCGECLNQCRAKALNLIDNIPRLSQDKCLGCGLCASNCPSNAIEMKYIQDRVIKQSEPGWIKMTLIYIFMYTYMFPMFFLFQTFTGNHQFKRENIEPNDKDRAVLQVNTVFGNESPSTIADKGFTPE